MQISLCGVRTLRGSGRQRARPERPAPEGLARTAQRGAGLPLPGPAGTRRDPRLPQLPAEGSSSARTVEESAPTVWPHGNSEEEDGGGKGTCTERSAKRVHIAYFMFVTNRSENRTGAGVQRMCVSFLAETDQLGDLPEVPTAGSAWGLPAKPHTPEWTLRWRFQPPGHKTSSNQMCKQDPPSGSWPGPIPCQSPSGPHCSMR